MYSLHRAIAVVVLICSACHSGTDEGRVFLSQRSEGNCSPPIYQRSGKIEVQCSTKSLKTLIDEFLTLDVEDYQEERDKRRLDVHNFLEVPTYLYAIREGIKGKCVYDEINGSFAPEEKMVLSNFIEQKMQSKRNKKQTDDRVWEALFLSKMAYNLSEEQVDLDNIFQTVDDIVFLCHLDLDLETYGIYLESADERGILLSDGVWRILDTSYQMRFDDLEYEEYRDYSLYLQKGSALRTIKQPFPIDADSVLCEERWFAKGAEVVLFSHAKKGTFFALPSDAAGFFSDRTCWQSDGGSDARR